MNKVILNDKISLKAEKKNNQKPKRKLEINKKEKT